MLTRTEKFNSDVIQQMADLINKYLSGDRFTLSFSIIDEDIFSFAENVLNDKLYADIERFANSDPAATHAADPIQYVFESYKGMQAVLAYRVANSLVYNTDILLQSEMDIYHDPFDEDSSANEAKNYFYLLARKISEDAAIRTGIEINPSAIIDQGLVIDHGFRTKIAVDNEGIVIGETCEIGKDCTILNGVTIGAYDVNQGEKIGRRHPKIGSNVTICANVRLLGAIEIGDNVMISPFSVITHNVPSDCKVSIINQLQIERIKNSNAGIVIYGIIPFGDKFLISGENLLGCDVFLCDSDTLKDEFSVDIYTITDKVIEFSMIENMELPEKISICIKNGNERIYILQPNAINLFKGKGDSANG